MNKNIFRGTFFLFILILFFISLSLCVVYAYVSSLKFSCSVQQSLNFSCSLSHNNAVLFTTTSDVTSTTSEDYGVQPVGTNTIKIECLYKDLTLNANSEIEFIVTKPNSETKTLFASLEKVWVYDKEITLPSEYVTVVTGSTLKIKFDSSFNFQNNDKIIFYICIGEGKVLTIDPNGGVYNSTTSSTIVSALTNLPTNLLQNPVRTGYTFQGWQEKNTSTNSESTDGYYYYGYGKSDYSNYVYETASSYVPNGVGTEVYTGLGGDSGPYCRNTGCSMIKTIVADEQNPVTNGYGNIKRTTTTVSVKSGSLYFAGMTYTARNLISGHQYYYVIVAKIPVGWNLYITGNSVTFSYQKWLTSVAGTGDWCTYIYSCKMAKAGANMNYGHIYIASSTEPTGNVIAELAMAKWYDYSMTRSVLTGHMLNSYYIGENDTTLTAMWCCKEDTITCTPNNSSYGAYSFTSENLFNNTNSEIMTGGKLYSMSSNPGSWSGSVGFTSNSNYFISSSIPIIAGATYKITGASESGHYSWFTSTTYTTGSKLESYTNNTEFTVPTNYYDTSKKSYVNITYTYLRFDGLLSDLQNIKLVLVSTPTYTSTQSIKIISGTTLTVLVSPNSGYSATITKKSGNATFTSPKLTNVLSSIAISITYA